MDSSKIGTKHSLLVEAGGVPVSLSVAGANRNDFKRLEQTIQSIAVDKPAPTRRRPPHVCLDKGYDYDEVRAILQADGFVAHIRSHAEEAAAKKKKLGQKARRWVVERTHSWFNRFRSILIRWSKKAENYLGMLCFVCGLIAYRAALFLDRQLANSAIKSDGTQADQPFIPFSSNILQTNWYGPDWTASDLNALSACTGLFFRP